MHECTRLERLVRLSVMLACLCAVLPLRAVAGDLEPPGPPSPTMRTLDSLGFDCPADKSANQTNLLYTFMTNVGGFDTGFSISNTGLDPFGTALPACPNNVCECVLNFYGGGNSIPVHTPGIPPGATHTDLVSVRVPGFTGYMIATCNFPYAHGFAFISDVGARNLAMGYLATVICGDRNSTAMGPGR